MKLVITEEQLLELSEEAKQKYADWCIAHGYHTVTEEIVEGTEYEVELMNIGMIMHYLADKGAYKYWYKTVFEDPEKACDKLWKAAVMLLEDKTDAK